MGEVFTLRNSTMIRGPLGLVFAACLTAAVLFNSAACAGGQTPGAAREGAKQEEAKQPAATPARINAAELSKLRWIEGAWRGGRR